MKIAIPTLNQRISPLLDTARVIAIFEINGDNFSEVNRFILDGLSFIEKSEAIKNAGADCLICGALSKQLLKILLSMGIETIPWKIGEINEIINAFINDNLFDEKYLMPGCRGMRRRCRLRGRQQKGKI